MEIEAAPRTQKPNMSREKSPVFDAGKLVIDYLKKQEKSIEWLARKLETSGQNLGRKLRSGYMSLDTLAEISDALEHNFFNDLSELYLRKHFNMENILSEPGMKYGAPESFDRYIELIVERKVAEKLKNKS